MDLNQIACLIIANAGDSKSDSMAAISAAQEGNFQEADRLLYSSSDTLLKAHEIHTQILVSEANENHFEMTFLLVHASNHLSISENTRYFAEVIVNMFKEFKKNV